MKTRSNLTRIAAVATLCLGTGLGGAALAAPHGSPGMGPMMGHRMGHVLEDVGATAEQRSQIRQIMEAARTAGEADRQATRALRDQMAALFTQPTVDANAVEALRQQMLAQHDRRSQRMTQAMLETSRVLSPEQRQAIAERMAARRDKQGERRDGRRGAQPRQDGAPAQ